MRGAVTPDLKQFFRHSGNYLLSNGVPKLLSILVLPVITWRILPSDYGKYSLFMALSTVMQILFLLSIHGSLNRYWFEKDQTDYSSFLGSNLLFLGMFHIIIALSAPVWVPAAASAAGAEPQLVWFAVAASVAGGYSMLRLSVWQARKQSGVYARFSIIRSALVHLLILGVLFLMSGQRYKGIIYAYTSVTALAALWSLVSLVKEADFRQSFSERVSSISWSLRYSLPLIPHSLSGVILVYFDKIILNRLEGSSSVGLYSIGFQAALILQLVLVSFNSSWVPVFFEKMNSGAEREIRKLVVSYARVVFVFSLLLALFGPGVLRLVVHSDYYEGISVFRILLTGYLVFYFYLLLTNISFYRKKTFLISLFTITACGVNIVLNYLFIPVYGMKAAAWATLVSMSVLVLLHWITVRFVYRETVLPLLSLCIGLLVYCAGLGAAVYAESLTASAFIRLGVQFTAAGGGSFLIFRILNIGGGDE